MMFRRKLLAVFALTVFLSVATVALIVSEGTRRAFARTDDETLRAQLAGAAIDPVERDAPPVGAGRFAPGE